MERSCRDALRLPLATDRREELADALLERQAPREASSQSRGWPRVTFMVLVGHRGGWILVLDDGAGDGYFHDPGRAGSEGAFFHHMSEGVGYQWFPSVRNFLAGVIECYESGVLPLAEGDVSMQQYFEREEATWARLSVSSGE